MSLLLLQTLVESAEGCPVILFPHWYPTRAIGQHETVVSSEMQNSKYHTWTWHIQDTSKYAYNNEDSITRNELLKSRQTNSVKEGYLDMTNLSTHVRQPDQHNHANNVPVAAQPWLWLGCEPSSAPQLLLILTCQPAELHSPSYGWPTNPRKHAMSESFLRCKSHWVCLQVDVHWEFWQGKAKNTQRLWQKMNWSVLFQFLQLSMKKEKVELRKQDNLLLLCMVWRVRGDLRSTETHWIAMHDKHGK